MKNLIIQEIKNNYNITIDYKGFDNYMNTSFEDLAKSLGYRLVRNVQKLWSKFKGELKWAMEKGKLDLVTGI